MKFGLSQIQKPTPAKMVKLGGALIGLSTVIAGYGLTVGIHWVGYTGLGCAASGYLFTNLFGASETP